MVDKTWKALVNESMCIETAGLSPEIVAVKNNSMHLFLNTNHHARALVCTEIFVSHRFGRMTTIGKSPPLLQGIIASPMKPVHQASWIASVNSIIRHAI
jgi:hypothetical protein